MTSTPTLVRRTAPAVEDRQARLGRVPRVLRVARACRRFIEWHPVYLIAGVAVLLRLPMLAAAPGADEAGYLMVGGQWGPGGSSLYGNYWVDRPPLLISIFRVAAQLGGLVPLRVIGCMATLFLVTGAAHLALRLGGRTAAVWAALLAAAWCVSPLTGSAEVNGELLAAPFVVWGIDTAMGALGRIQRQGRIGRRTGWLVAASGALAVSALLVKQNFADVGVFVVVCLAIASVRGEVTRHNCVRFAALFASGAAGVVSVVAAWTVLHGTSLVGVYEAMYPFRLHAAAVMAASSNHAPAIRFADLFSEWVFSGLGLVFVLTTWALLSRRLRSTGAYGLVAVLFFGTASVVAGGNFWSHYLMQLVAPAAVLAGVLVARRQIGMRFLVLAAAAVTVVAYWAALPGYGTSPAQRLGEAIGASSRPGDTIVTVYGHANVSEASGLSSPYPYLWSLPLKTLDPRLDKLDRVLIGRRAPTWLVSYAQLSSWGVHSGRTSRIVHRDYHRVADIDGHTVYLRDGVSRTPPSVSHTPVSASVSSGLGSH